MATSAIGPGFLTQTAKFTGELTTSFGFVILLSLLLDIGAQLNIWRIVAVTGLPAQEISSRLLPGAGLFLALLIGFGGLAFNVGNIAGTALGLEALAGIDSRIGAVLSALLSLLIFWYKEAGPVIDRLVKILGLLMIGLTLYVAISSGPPLAEALYRTVWPERIDAFKIITLVGGTVGGYISFAGAHRLLEAGVKGPASLPAVSRSAVNGIAITTLMRYILFLAALGVVSQGLRLNPGNPAASVFELAAGRIGYRFFGFVMWCAAITSVIGASYTTLSFFRTVHPFFARRQRALISVFILFSTAIFLWMGNPVNLLVIAGALNGLILPVALLLMLLAARRPSLTGGHRHPLWMQIAGWLVVLVMGYMAAAGLIS